MVDASDSVIASIGKLAAPISHRSASAAGRQRPRSSAALPLKRLSSVRFLCLQSAAAVRLIWQASSRRSQPTPSWCSACSIRPASQRWLPFARELNSDTSTLCLMGYELVVAWCVAFIVRQIGLMLASPKNCIRKQPQDSCFENWAVIFFVALARGALSSFFSKKRDGASHRTIRYAGAH